MTTQEWSPPAKMRYTFLSPTLATYWKAVRDSGVSSPLDRKVSWAGDLQLAVLAVASGVYVSFLAEDQGVVPPCTDVFQRFLRQVPHQSRTQLVDGAPESELPMSTVAK